MHFKEIELKYRADNVLLSDFQAYCESSKKPYSFLHASGYDYFYDDAVEPGEFCRHRVGADMNQLTFKRKTTNKNNYIRTEHNINLAKDTTVDQVSALCSEFGFSFNTSIFKTCFVYKFQSHTAVYYVCYDIEMKELGRFIEIELDENRNWGDEENAMKALQVLEQDMSRLGLKPQSRVKKSLFELFRK